jgi:hypothetical protein
MNVFPNTETYLVTWLGGSCGAFITSLVYQFVVSPIDDFTFSKFGHAHGVALDKCVGNWKNINSVRYADFYEEKVSVFSSVDPLISSRPLILYDHLVPNLDELFTKYPLCKNIVIEMDKRTVNRVQGNLFFKTIVQEFPKSLKVWEDLQRKYPSYFKEYADPKDVPVELSERYIREWGSRWPFPNVEFFMADYAIPEQYKNNLFHINVYDIIHNRDLVLETISKITNKPILPNIIQYYDAYLAKQDVLVKTHMPWLDDK